MHLVDCSHMSAAALLWTVATCAYGKRTSSRCFPNATLPTLGQISLMVRKFILAHPELSQREKESISYAIKQKSMAGRAGVGGANRDGRLPPSQQVERGAPPPAAPIRQPDSYLARQEARGEFRPPPGGPLDRDETRERSRPSSETRQVRLVLL